MSTDGAATDSFSRALALIDAAHTDDPAREWSGTGPDAAERPAELLYAERMTAWLERLDPEASEALRLACRAQHLRRWELARSDYPMDRVGYHRFSGFSKIHFADCADAMLGMIEGDRWLHEAPIVQY